jgi:predicted acyl esterase
MTGPRAVLALALLAWGAPARSQHVEASPPEPRTFGPDRTSTGAFTGQGLTPVGVACDEPASPDAALTCSGFLASGLDGTLLEVVVRVPRSLGPHPLVVGMHGWGGSAGSMARYDDRLTGAGYVFLRYSARGFGASWGQTNLADVNVEGASVAGADLRSMIGQVVDDVRFAADPGAVAVFGASYGGAHAWLAAIEPSFQSPRGQPVVIRTVVPIAAWSDFVNGLVPNGRPQQAHEVAGALKLSYGQALFVGGLRARLDRPYPNYPAYLFDWNAAMVLNDGPYASNALAADFVNGAQGYRSAYWQRPFWERASAGARLPILLVQGWTDDLFPAVEALRMYDALRSIDPAWPVALYLGDVGHPRAANKAGEIDHVLDLVVAWLDGWMPGGAPPPVEVRAAITRAAAAPFDPADVVTAASYAALATGSTTLAFGGLPKVITFNPLNVSGFRWDPVVLAGCAELQPCPSAPASDVVPGDVAAYEASAAAVAGGARFLLATEPGVAVRIATFAHRVQLDVRLIDVAPDGARSLVTRGTLTIDTGSPTVPIGTRTARIATFGNLWEVPPDHRLRLEITNVDAPYLRPTLVPSVTTLWDVRLTIPFRPPPR